MLQKLFIQNYAIIDEINIDFHTQFNIITGETGAGKSILVGAMGLVLGNRADSSVLLNTDKKCIVEANFLVERNNRLNQLIAEAELDFDNNELLIRREITSNGKSRSFINDTPVTLQVLKQFTALLVDLHLQFDTLDVGAADFQRDVLDALASNESLLIDYRKEYQQYATLTKKLEALKAEQAKAKADADYYNYLHTELAEANFKPDEIETLEDELKLLSNSENILATLNGINSALTETEQPITQVLKSFVNQLHALKTSYAPIVSIAERLQSAQIEIADIADEIETAQNGISLNDERKQLITERIDIGNTLLKKHNAANTKELLATQQKINERLQQVLNIDDEITEVEKQVQLHHNNAKGLALQVSTNRKKQAEPFTAKLHKLLAQVGMPNARLKIDITACPLNKDGVDTINFLFDANKTNHYEPIYKVASGGELSRLMLCIKNIVAQSMQMPTLIFDEIDTGISGEAARQVGIIMKNLSEHHQLISITHQPQIAAKANNHYYVHKKEIKGQVKTQIRLLTDDERVEAIAAMLSGSTLTESSKSIAKEMMG
jgi:DNA repair protein RecN (Recombination protein N)